MDIIYFKIFKSKKIDNNLLKMIGNFKDKEIPTMPFKADILMGKYNISEGKELGKKLKAIEEVWTNNDFKITEKEVQDIVNG